MFPNNYFFEFKSKIAADPGWAFWLMNLGKFKLNLNVIDVCEVPCIKSILFV